MKNIFFVFIVLIGYGSVYSQQELVNEIKKQAVTIDSLKRVVIQLENLEEERDSKINKLEDNLKILKTELSALESFKTNQNNLNIKLKQKSDSISSLTIKLSQSEKSIYDTNELNNQKVIEAKEQGKQEALVALSSFYLKNNFDILIKSSTKQSIEKDLKLFVNQMELKSLLSDLEKYFNAKELLNKKYDAVQLQKSQNVLNQIKRESELISKLKNDLRLYKTYNDGLKNALNEIVNLDKIEKVSGWDAEFQKRKYYKISAFIFNYDFNLIDYPYLSDIVLEVIKRKIPSPDADVTDLIEKLY
jgi:TolA-binding protein